jgi:hypothetical protein
METNVASEHLQTIRTLMERSALYRRALAPVMLLCGGVGSLAGVAGNYLQIDTSRGFAMFWMLVSLAVLTLTLVLVRRQALKDSEPFWSLPTKRITQALLPAFFLGLAAGVFHIIQQPPDSAWLLAFAWILTYGCAIHAAGFFMRNRMQLFGWILVLSGCGLLFAASAWPWLRSIQAAHYLMGLHFGLLHLACGVYLRFTEPSRHAA